MADDVQFDPADWEFDPTPSDLFTPSPVSKARVAVIRTSDRITFKRCRRRWHWSSHLRTNLQPVRSASPLWFGSGVHFALEDFHGANEYKHPWTAFKAYVKASKAYRPDALPTDWKDLCFLARGMLSYYAEYWLQMRDPYKTFVWNGVPQVEVNARIPIPFDATKYGYDQVVYSLTLDRVVIDDDGNLWIQEYKTAKNIQTHFFPTDPQVTSYMWAAEQLYPGYKIMGVIYQQHKKAIPEFPEVLSTGRLSTNTKQSTTYHLYRHALIRQYGKEYGTVAPPELIGCLNHFASLEDQWTGDKFIRRDRVYRNEQMCASEGEKILMEVEEMLNPNLALYPNPVRECIHMCPFSGPCVSLDDGSDWEQELEALFELRPKGYDDWRRYLPEPQALLAQP